MRKMRKTIAIVLACMLLAALAASCNNDTADTGSQNTSTNDSGSTSPTGGTANAGGTTPATTSGTVPASTGGGTSNTPANSFDASRIIAVYTREEGSGTRDAFISLTGVGEDMYIEAIVNNETNQILTNVETNDNAIGYVSVGSLNPAVKALSVNGVTPSNATITDGSYTLQRPFVVCINEANQNNPLVSDFISFILSAEGQEITATKWTAITQTAAPYTTSGLAGTLKVGGSTSVEPLMQVLSQAYRVHNPNIVIEISGGGSGTGISEATSGVLDIGMSSRALRDNEKESLTGTDIALDGVAVIVNPANPMSDITIEQIKDIFTGEVTRWNQVTG